VSFYLSVWKIATATGAFRGRILIFDATLRSVFRYLDKEKKHGRTQNQSSGKENIRQGQKGAH
jgi:hypothetical protein